mgnify:FL=1
MARIKGQRRSNHDSITIFVKTALTTSLVVEYAPTWNDPLDYFPAPSRVWWSMFWNPQWFLLKPNRLPRGINLIIMATMYHLPGKDDYALRNHILQFLDRALNRYPNSGIVLLGDFNQFNPGSLCSSFKLKKAVHLPTRGNNTLDQICTSLGDFYDPATTLLPIGKSDHACVIKCTVQISLPSRRTF